MTTFTPKNEMIKHKSRWIPPDYRAGVIVGKSRSGKTSVLPELLEKLHNFNNLIVFTPNHKQEVYKFLYEKYKDKNLIRSKTLDADLIDKNEDLLKNSKHNVCIIDDFVDKKKLENISFLASRGRHLNLSVYFIVQRWFNLPQLIRDNINEILLFNVNTISYLFRDLPIDNKDDFKRLYSEVSNQSYKFMYICTDPNLHKALRLRKGFDGILKRYINDY